MLDTERLLFKRLATIESKPWVQLSRFLYADIGQQHTWQPEQGGHKSKVTGTALMAIGHWFRHCSICLWRSQYPGGKLWYFPAQVHSMDDWCWLSPELHLPWCQTQSNSPSSPRQRSRSNSRRRNGIWKRENDQSRTKHNLLLPSWLFNLFRTNSTKITRQSFLSVCPGLNTSFIPLSTSKLHNFAERSQDDLAGQNQWTNES